MEYTSKWIKEETLKNPEKTIEVWACSYEHARSAQGIKHSHLKPVKGVLKIKKIYCWSEFYPYGKKGVPLYSKGRPITRHDHYFDNKEECVEFYIQKVQDRIIDLEEQIKDLNLLIDNARKLL